MKRTVYQFQINGSRAGSPYRATYEGAAQDAIDAGYAFAGAGGALFIEDGEIAVFEIEDDSADVSHNVPEKSNF